KWGDKVMEIGGGKIGPITQKLYDTMTGMQFGKIPDDMGWIEKL
ncbi:MAG TPA: branched chain amino acid aminotransferase, partial [Ruminococcaceae bacterium]|nr:branched chain amino acid aminotransferase [Oscillospiraceae bacterium]